jgi:hypothetical protein
MNSERPEGMLRITQLPYNTYYINYRQVGAETSKILKITPAGMIKQKGDFQDVLGNVFAVELPAGDYEIYDYSFYFNNGLASVSYTTNEEISHKFKVDEGMVSYIGNFAAHHQYVKNIMGTLVNNGGYYILFNEFDRDVKRLKEVYPWLANFDIIISDSLINGEGTKLISESDSNVRTLPNSAYTQ